MILGKHRLEETVKDGIKVIGYTVLSQSGMTSLKSREEVERLALNGYIVNATARMDSKTGKITLEGLGCKLRDLPIRRLQVKDPIKRYQVRGIFRQNRVTVGYKVVSSSGEVEDWPINKAIENTQKGVLQGVYVQKFGENYRLRGKNGVNLDSLPVYKIG